jgi:hypothetical protein
MMQKIDGRRYFFFKPTYENMFGLVNFTPWSKCSTLKAQKTLIGKKIRLLLNSKENFSLKSDYFERGGKKYSKQKKNENSRSFTLHF